jgi:hypothetical protein
MREALLRKQDLLQDKQYNDIMIIEKLSKEAEVERERALKAREEKRLRERQVAIENDIQVRGKQAHRLNQKELD